MGAQLSRTGRLLRRALTLNLGAAAIGCALLSATTPAAANASSSGMVRIGGVAPIPAGAVVLAGSASAASKNLQLTVTLKPRNLEAMNAYASNVTRASSRDFRRYLTAKQFRARFAPTTATVRRVEAAMRGRGLKVTGVTANRLGVNVTGSGAQVEQAFSIAFLRLRLANHRTALINAEAPAVSRAIAPAITDVVGLNGMETMTTGMLRTAARTSSERSRVAVDGNQPSTSGPKACTTAVRAEYSRNGWSRGAYTQNQIASYYDFGGLYRAGDRGQDISVGLYELENNSPQDIAEYQKCYGTHAKVSYINVHGGSGKGHPNGSGEAALDIEQIVSLAPRVHVLVYRGRNSSGDSPSSGPYLTYAEMIGQDRAAVISTSWGECEKFETRKDASQEQTLFKEAAIQGQTILAAAGDDGAEDCFSSNNLSDSSAYTPAVDDPASQPWITGVGGTSLRLAQSPAKEVVWNNSFKSGDYSRGAGGGGLSNFWVMPNYQVSATGSADVVDPEQNAVFDDPGAFPDCVYPQYCRAVPDVSASADPGYGYLVYYHSDGQAWQSFGGTSAAAPLWAAMFALADAYKGCAGSRVGFANPALYALASGGSYSSYFHDVTSGNNDFTGENLGLFQAGDGYDMATGLGTPKADALVSALCADSIEIGGTHDVHARVGDSVHMQFTAELEGSSSGITFNIHHMPAGLSFDSSTGLLTGTLTRTGTTHTVVTAYTDSGSPASNYGARGFNWVVLARKR